MNTYRFFHWNIVASDHREFLERLWLTSYTDARTPRAYMEEVAHRAFKAYGDMIRTYNVKVFVSDIIRAGYLKIEVTEKN